LPEMNFEQPVLRMLARSFRWALALSLMAVLYLAAGGLPQAAGQTLSEQERNARLRDIELIQTLGVMSAKKGKKDVPLNGACSALGMSLDDAHCVATHEAFLDDEDAAHSFSVVIDGQAVYAVMAKSLVPFARGGNYYLIDMSELNLSTPQILRAAAARRGTAAGTSWSRSPVESREVRESFAAELGYWRAKQSELAAEPDRRD
jgi:hypothetical protein